MFWPHRTHPVLIQGETSVGKTSLIRWLAAATGNQCVRINNHEHTDIQEYIGCYSSDDRSRLVFKEGMKTHSAVTLYLSTCLYTQSISTSGLFHCFWTVKICEPYVKIQRFSITRFHVNLFLDYLRDLVSLSKLVT